MKGAVGSHQSRPTLSSLESPTADWQQRFIGWTEATLTRAIPKSKKVKPFMAMWHGLRSSFIWNMKPEFIVFREYPEFYFEKTLSPIYKTQTLGYETRRRCLLGRLAQCPLRTVYSSGSRTPAASSPLLRQSVSTAQHHGEHDDMMNTATWCRLLQQPFDTPSPDDKTDQSHKHCTARNFFFGKIDAT